MKTEEIVACVEVKSKGDKDIQSFLSEAYCCLKDMKSFPNYMENVIRIVIEESDTDSSIITWDCMIEDAEFSWKQRTFYDEVNRTIKFELIEGDFDALEGAWQVVEDTRKFYLRLTLKYSIGLPVIEDVLGPIVKKKLKENSLSMLNSIKEKLEEFDGR